MADKTNKLKQSLNKIKSAYEHKSVCTALAPMDKLYYKHEHFSEHQKCFQHSAGG